MSYLIESPQSKEAAGQDGCLERAKSLFESFHCYAPPEIIRMPCRRILPRTLVRLGELRAVIYRSDRAQPGRPRTFIHFWDTPPMLACDPQGRQLHILGGNYRVTRKGIEG